LRGGAIICRACNHNNALRGDWRSQRSSQQTAPRHTGVTQSNQTRANQSHANQSRDTKPLTELPKIVPRKDLDANLLRFPPASNKQLGVRTEAPQTMPRQQTVTGSEAATVVYPPWRAELKERVREIKEKRNTGELVAPPPSPVRPDEAALDRNPIVESALNRIRWASHTPAARATVSASKQGAATATAAMPAQAEIETERQREGEMERRGVSPSIPPSLHPAVSPSLRPEVRPEPRADVRVEPRFATPKPNQAHRELGRTGNRPAAPAINRSGEQSKPQTVSQPANQIVSKAGNQAPPPTASRPLANQVETKTLTPKIHREADARPEPKPAPAPTSRLLTPRVKPPAAAESKAELRHERPEPEAPPQPAAEPSLINKQLADAPDKHVETQVIEIAQAPELLPLPEAEPASLWVRTMAGACDFEIIFTAYLPLFGAYAVLNNGNSFGDKSHFIMLLLLSAIVFIYQMVMLAFAGRTSGMALLNLTLLNTDDESMPVTRRQKILRGWAATVVFICFPLYLFPWFNLSRRSMPDLISGTTVAKQ